MWDTMNHLAKTEKAMLTTPIFTPPSNSLALYAAKTLKTTDELFHFANNIQQKMLEFNWPISPHTKTALEYINEVDNYCRSRRITGKELFESVEKELRAKNALLENFTTSLEHIKEQRIALLERGQVYRRLSGLVPEEILNTANRIGQRRRFNNLLGLIPSEHMPKVRKLLFRISRENVLLKSVELELLEDEFVKEDKPTRKTLIFVLFPKSGKKTLVKKIGSTLKFYDFVSIETKAREEREEDLLELAGGLEDNETVLVETKAEINGILSEFARPKIVHRLSYLQAIKLIIQREKQFAKNLSFVEQKEGFYQLHLWVPYGSLNELHNRLDSIRTEDPTFTQPSLVELDKSHPETKNLKTPTFFRLNDFTRPFQLIIDTYGVPAYKEANPGLFTIITFPFMYGIMFGDIGHGLMLVLVGIYLTVFLDDKNSILNSIKYLILLMGLFAFYCGWIYNEFFAVPFLTQDSCYILNEVTENGFRRRHDDCTYSFGIDWIWHQSSNETSFVNSFKMKFSIIVGVIQMLFGLLLKALNGAFFKRWVDVWFEALPQLIFMLVTFGYMSFCIIAKWCQDWSGREPVSIIQLFINFISVDQPLFATAGIQQSLQTFFAILCFVCIILMLVPKPIILHKQAKKKRKVDISFDDGNSEQYNNLINRSKDSNTSDDFSRYSDDEHEEPLGELFVHQMIETIEFVLGSVSNTASYLRLWALSLAHTQLSRVFLNMIFKFTIEESSSIIVSFFVIVIGFTFFFFVTFAVIMIMDAMECFLHALRLHWVEFQNKFYKGDGKAFRVFRHSFYGENEDDEG